MQKEKKSEPRRCMSTVKIGPKGQIVIPKEMREMFGIKPGDSLLLLADESQGIAIQKMSVMSAIADLIFSGKGGEIYPGEKPENTSAFAREIKRAESGENDEKDGESNERH